MDVLSRELARHGKTVAAIVTIASIASFEGDHDKQAWAWSGLRVLSQRMKMIAAEFKTGLEESIIGQSTEKGTRSSCVKELHGTDGRRTAPKFEYHIRSKPVQSFPTSPERNRCSCFLFFAPQNTELWACLRRTEFLSLVLHVSIYLARIYSNMGILIYTMAELLRYEIFIKKKESRRFPWEDHLSAFTFAVAVMTRGNGPIQRIRQAPERRREG